MGLGLSSVLLFGNVYVTGKQWTEKASTARPPAAVGPCHHLTRLQLMTGQVGPQLAVVSDCRAVLCPSPWALLPTGPSAWTVFSVMLRRAMGSSCAHPGNPADRIAGWIREPDLC